jgi:phosphoenolpyruvate-protein kinase (PTS system EI component)
VNCVFSVSSIAVVLFPSILQHTVFNEQEEAVRVVEEMRRNGLTQGKEESSLKVMGMCEVPANVILADKFLDVLDGFSIGSNDLV